MRSIISGSLLVAVAHSQLLDIPALLASLGPAPATDPRFQDWQAPGANDARGPCPGLNTLANHGFLNRDGRNNSIPQLIQGGAAGLNMGPDFMTVIGAVGLLSSKDPATLTFDLDDLDHHNFPIEHDVSLSRQDHYFGDWYDFDQTIWDGTLTYFAGLNNTTTPTASAARYARVKSCLTNNPECVYGLQQFILSSGETGLYVQSMSSPAVNSAPIEYVKTFFEQNKLPFDQGWRPSSDPVTLLTLGSYILELFAANPDNTAEGFAVVEDSYADVFVDLVGGSEALHNLTEGISDYLDIPGL